MAIPETRRAVFRMLITSLLTGLLATAVGLSGGGLYAEAITSQYADGGVIIKAGKMVWPEHVAAGERLAYYLLAENGSESPLDILLRDELPTCTAYGGADTLRLLMAPEGLNVGYEDASRVISATVTLGPTGEISATLLLSFEVVVDAELAEGTDTITNVATIQYGDTTESVHAIARVLTVDPTLTHTSTPTLSPTPTQSPSPAVTPSSTATPTATNSPTPTSTSTPTETTTQTPTPTLTSTTTPTPGTTSTPTATPPPEVMKSWLPLICRGYYICSFEPNDYFDTAYPIEVGATIQSEICWADDPGDFYRSEDDIDGTYAIELSAPDQDADLDLYLYDRYYELVERSVNGPGEKERIEEQLSADHAPYYIWVFPYEIPPDRLVRYSLTVTVGEG